MIGAWCGDISGSSGNDSGGGDGGDVMVVNVQCWGWWR